MKSRYFVVLSDTNHFYKSFQFLTNKFEDTLLLGSTMKHKTTSIFHHFFRKSMIKICLLALISSISIITIGQKTEDDYASGKSKTDAKAKTKVPFKERLVFGGNLGGYFGNPTFVQINPMVGYKTTKWWVNGVGVNYMYLSSGNYSRSIYGASVWSRAYAFQSLFVQTEFEMLSLKAKNPSNEEFHANVPVWFVGAGYQSTGGGLGLSVMILYDVIQDENSPYSTPVFRIGGLFGF